MERPALSTIVHIPFDKKKRNSENGPEKKKNTGVGPNLIHAPFSSAEKS